MIYTTKDHTYAVCAYKESTYLEECICSLKNQTVSSNIIICTATPNAFIQSVADKYSLPLFINTGAHGIAEDWNFAYECADTALVTLAHQDDIYEPEYTETMLDHINQHDDTSICFSDYFEVRNGEKIDYRHSGNLRIKELLLLPLRVNAFQKRRWVIRRILSVGNPICCPAVTYVKDKISSPVFPVHFKSNVDWQTWERLSNEGGRFLYVPKALMGHRIHSESTTTEIIGDGNGRYQEDLEMFYLFWPKPVARVIAKIYAFGQKSN